MSLRSSIQENLILKPRIRKNIIDRANKAFVSLDQAKTLGIIADFRAEDQLKKLSTIYQEIKKQDVHYHVLILLGQKRAEVNLYQFEKNLQGAQITLVCDDDYSRIGTPKKSIVEPFWQPSYDILFRLVATDCFEVDYILSGTHAKMYAGADHPGLEYLDFTISLAAGQGLDQLASNLVVYIRQIDQDITTQKTDYTLF